MEIIKTREREKQSAAANSVCAAVFLVFVKLVIGVITGSLGILAEAAHSGLDLVAALITFTAVRFSDRPADETHTYGHGKIENFSALIETLLLFITCAWIIYEAIQRLFFVPMKIDPSFWAFTVMMTSIIVDANRSRMLYRVARKYHSQALEADALHFSTDIWSSTVVLAGLAAVWLGQNALPNYVELLNKSDALSAMGVAVIVVLVSYRLGRRTVDVLLDRTPEIGLMRRLEKEVSSVKGVIDCHRIRLRRSGGRTFADMHIVIDEKTPLEVAHKVASGVEERVRRLIPDVDIVVHMEPSPIWKENLVVDIRELATSMPGVRGVHDIMLRDVHGNLYVELHLELSGSLTLREAHETATLYEERVKAKVPGVAGMVTHLEPTKERPTYGEDVTEEASSVAKEALNLALKVEGVKDVHDVMVRRVGGQFHVSLHCALDEGLSLDEVHSISNHIERHIVERVQDVAHVIVHVEPVTFPKRNTHLADATNS